MRLRTIPYDKISTDSFALIKQVFTIQSTQIYEIKTLQNICSVPVQKKAKKKKVLKIRRKVSTQTNLVIRTREKSCDRSLSPGRNVRSFLEQTQFRTGYDLCKEFSSLYRSRKSEIVTHAPMARRIKSSLLKVTFARDRDFR